MTADDLRNYQPIVRAPVRGSYRGYDIVSMPPSSSGGVILIEMLNILEGFDLAAADAGAAPPSPGRSDEARLCRPRGVPRRSRHRASPARSPDVEGLRRRDARQDRLHGATTILDAAGEPPHEGENTTHYSVVDGLGNAVSNTYTLNFSYGLGLVAEGTGVLLNNELDDFAAAPRAPNAYGLIGGEANAPGPGKRPLSSMTPTIVLKDGKPFLVTGSPGGSRIITTVLQIVSNVIDRGLPIAEAVAAPRVHHQWSPDYLEAERGQPADVLAELRARGHKVQDTRPFGSANSILVTPQGFVGAADARTRGSLAAGY